MKVARLTPSSEMTLGGVVMESDEVARGDWGGHYALFLYPKKGHSVQCDNLVS